MNRDEETNKDMQRLIKRGGDKQRYVETDEERRRQTDISRD